MTDIPHFDYPFAFDTSSHAAEVEQDTIDDVANCISVAFMTEAGTRLEVPTFGVPGQVFEIQPLDLQTLINSIEEWESRADTVLSQITDATDFLTDRITAVITLRKAARSG